MVYLRFSCSSSSGFLIVFLRHNLLNTLTKGRNLTKLHRMEVMIGEELDTLARRDSNQLRKLLLKTAFGDILYCNLPTKARMSSIKVQKHVPIPIFFPLFFIFLCISFSGRKIGPFLIEFCYQLRLFSRIKLFKSFLASPLTDFCH